MPFTGKIVSGTYVLSSRKQRCDVYDVGPKHLDEKLKIFNHVEIRSEKEMKLSEPVPPGWSDWRVPGGTVDYIPWISEGDSLVVRTFFSPQYPKISINNLHKEDKLFECVVLSD